MVGARVVFTIAACAWAAASALPAPAQTSPESALALPPQPPTQDASPPRAQPPAAPGSAEPPAPPVAAAPSPGLPPEQVAGYRARFEVLAARQAALDAANAPAGPSELARLQAARDAAPAEEIRRFVADSLAWYADQMAGAAMPPLELPAGEVALDIAMVGFVLDFTPTAPDGRQGALRPRGSGALQVARVGSPEQSVLWLHDLGYVLIPGNYLEPFVQAEAPGRRTLLEVGR